MPNSPRLSFADRHLGPSVSDMEQMLQFVGTESLERLIENAAPKSILSKNRADLGRGLSEEEFLSLARSVAKKNILNKSYIGMGYYDCFTPKVILRNILENPGWYTAYTPYQAEISQGRMEALLNFQTMIMDLTGMEMANASLLDEGTAAAEAMNLCLNVQRKVDQKRFFVASDCLPQTIEVLQTRAEPLGIELCIAPPDQFDFSMGGFGVLLQYPSLTGAVENPSAIIEKAHAAGLKVVMAADLMALCLLTPPGELGADVVVGTSQRFGVPMGFGGPHAAFMATKEEFKRSIPGRIIGVSKDVDGKPALRLALQTREQHIRRERATSNICTAQVLLAVMASMYAVYHGPEGLKAIAQRIHGLAVAFSEAVRKLGFAVKHAQFFDTVCVSTDAKTTEKILSLAESRGVNLGRVGDDLIIAFDEVKTVDDTLEVINLFAEASNKGTLVTKLTASTTSPVAKDLQRSSAFLTHPTFNSYHSETEMLRYIHRLEQKDLALNSAMIPLGSCTMKLNATSEMIPVTWPEFSGIHPFAPLNQATGYLEMIHQLERWLSDLTGFSAVSLQPNAGSQGEYAGLLVIRKYLHSLGQAQRNVCLIPSSAHGTNPASAVMAGMNVVVVGCDNEGNIDIADLRAKADKHKDQLAALMVTYPSTHGVFEEGISEICKVIHDNGGQVYMDGANLNALVGVAKPGEFGPDVAHLNLHKTFCIPHGGGGPGIGPIGVAKHLAGFLPSHDVVPDCGPDSGIPAVSAAPWGSASILPISWGYIAMMGWEGLRKATQVAVLNANYIAKKLEPHFPVLYKSHNGWVAHECIIDLRPFKESAGVSVDDVAKRLMDFGFHAPTMSWPVAGTLMIEPTESESKEEMDRFCDAMIAIREEIKAIEEGKLETNDNPLVNAPHSMEMLMGSDWPHSYSREQAAFPRPWVKDHKFWVPIRRVDNAYGDRHLVCTCPSIDAYSES
ncbi:MAG: aminomethyl-transferring glycine dehydrogenase [Pseudobdellovibrionaceae bacterium]|nr:aminomethyl-transferring glycine dehydrogenase [Bdellovibrionales bacterium]USN47378.1 MAG: aminomethyl-transferring glycine dehydrogenase [Pseudobdellovibrionaceae bacterium]